MDALFRDFLWFLWYVLMAHESFYTIRLKLKQHSISFEVIIIVYTNIITREQILEHFFFYSKWNMFVCSTLQGLNSAHCILVCAPRQAVMCSTSATTSHFEAAPFVVTVIINVVKVELIKPLWTPRKSFWKNKVFEDDTIASWPDSFYNVSYWEKKKGQRLFFTCTWIKNNF